ncbi:MAG: hypothetical protein LUD00_00335, partial [Prevotellaceae bacterium]|nr:hypothetical protein [Prevotellaceae bacterium]
MVVFGAKNNNPEDNLMMSATISSYRFNRVCSQTTSCIFSGCVFGRLLRVYLAEYFRQTTHVYIFSGCVHRLLRRYRATSPNLGE